MTIQRAAASCISTRAHIFKSFLQGERETAAKTHRAMKFETRGFCAFVGARGWLIHVSHAAALTKAALRPLDARAHGASPLAAAARSPGRPGVAPLWPAARARPKREHPRDATAATPT